MDAAMHEAIGRVATAYGGLEFAIVSFTSQLINADHRVGNAIFAPMQMSRRIDLLRTLFKMLPTVGCDESPTAVASLAEWGIEPVPTDRLAEFERFDDSRQSRRRNAQCHHACADVAPRRSSDRRSGDAYF